MTRQNPLLAGFPEAVLRGQKCEIPEKVYEHQERNGSARVGCEAASREELRCRRKALPPAACTQTARAKGRESARCSEVSNWKAGGVEELLRAVFEARPEEHGNI